MPFGRDEAGQLWELDASGNPIRRVSGGAQQALPADPLKQGQAQAGLQGQNLNNQGQYIDNRVATATMGDVVRKTRAEATKAETEAAAAQRAFASGGLTPDKRAELQGNLNTISGVEGMLGKLRQRYNQDFAGKGIGSIAEYFPATMRPANGMFNDDARSLLSDMAKAKGLTSQQFNTPAEQRMFFEPLIPNASDTDEQIANKLSNLENMAGQGKRSTMQQLGMKDEATALREAEARLEQQIAGLPPKAQEIGRQRFYADPRIKKLMGKQSVTNAPRKQSSNVIDFNQWGN